MYCDHNSSWLQSASSDGTLVDYDCSAAVAVNVRSEVVVGTGTDDVGGSTTSVLSMNGA